MIDPCIAAADELAALTQWSQARDALQRWQWENGCNGEPPSNSPTAFNWGTEDRCPPRSYSVPGNPNDRAPPQY